MNKGILFLIPCSISDAPAAAQLSPRVLHELPSINSFLVEDVRTARRFLSSLKVFPSIENLRFDVLDKDTKAVEVESLLSPLLQGRSIGVISESGCPGVADPGALAVKYAHRMNVKVVPLVGPSSILLALMASGLNGQQFAFHGYLPIGPEIQRAIRESEKESLAKKQTQIFIETPYRNNQVFIHLTKTLKESTMLCVAIDITGSNEQIRTQRVGEWRQQKTEWPKLPAVFLILAE